jgi:hypothetical protein
MLHFLKSIQVETSKCVDFLKMCPLDRNYLNDLYRLLKNSSSTLQVHFKSMLTVHFKNTLQVYFKINFFSYKLSAIPGSNSCSLDQYQSLNPNLPHFSRFQPDIRQPNSDRPRRRPPYLGHPQRFPPNPIHHSPSNPNPRDKLESPR